MNSAKPRPRILVVDDAPANIKVLREALKSEYEVVFAMNGEGALRVATGPNPPDLVLLDVGMPDMDGYEVCRLLKNHEATRDIPVIFVTSRQGEEDETRGLELGAADYIIKPVSMATVKARLRNHLELKRHRDAVAEADEAKSRFLASMSHDIRTPMTAIAGIVDLLMETELSPEQLEYLIDIKTSAESLLALLNDIMDFSRIEAGKFKITPATFNLRDHLVDTLRTVSVTAHTKGLDVLYHVDSAVPEQVVGDPLRLRQVLLNLVGNAVKFTDEGQIEVNVTPVQSTEDLITVQFSVSDTGIGIETHLQGCIFDAYRQAHGVVSEELGGSGLGLAISAELVRLMDGRIWVDSRPGAGSTFRFEVSFGIATGSSEDKTFGFRAALPSCKALVVSPGAARLRLFRGWFEAWHIDSTTSSDGYSVPSLLEQARLQGSCFTLAIVDGLIPALCDSSLVERIKNEALQSGTAIVLLIPNGLHPPTDLAVQLGVAGTLTTPTRRLDLFRCMVRLLEGREGSTGIRVEARKPPLKASRRLRVLLVEDNPISVKMAGRMLQKMGHEVFLASNGHEAVQEFRKRPFDIVLMDVEMPGMDGITATRMLREREQTVGMHVPIIAMTAHALEGDRERCIEAGMDAYIAKPIDYEGLFRTIESFAKD